MSQQIDSSSKFYFKAKSAFLTYAQCPLEPKQVYEMINNAYMIHKCVIGQEHHQDGNLHLHAYIKFERPVTSRRPTVFDVGGYHPNIKKPLNPYGCIKYCAKENYNIFTHNLDVDEEIEARKGHKKILGKRLLSGEVKLIEAVKEDPSLLFGYKKIKADLEQFNLDNARH